MEIVAQICGFGEVDTECEEAARISGVFWWEKILLVAMHRLAGAGVYPAVGKAPPTHLRGRGGGGWAGSAAQLIQLMFFQGPGLELVPVTNLAPSNNRRLE